MSWAQLAAEKELSYGPTLSAPNSLSHLLKGISQGCIFYPDDFSTNLRKASPGWGLRSNGTFLEALLHLPPLLSLPLYVMMIAVKISPYIPSMSGGLYTFFKNLPSSPLVRRNHSLRSQHSVAMDLICSRLGLASLDS